MPHLLQHRLTCYVFASTGWALDLASIQPVCKRMGGQNRHAERQPRSQDMSWCLGQLSTGPVSFLGTSISNGARAGHTGGMHPVHITRRQRTCIMVPSSPYIGSCTPFSSCMVAVVALSAEDLGGLKVAMAGVCCKGRWRSAGAGRDMAEPRLCEGDRQTQTMEQTSGARIERREEKEKSMPTCSRRPCFPACLPDGLGESERAMSGRRRDDPRLLFSLCCLFFLFCTQLSFLGFSVALFGCIGERGAGSLQG